MMQSAPQWTKELDKIVSILDKANLEIAVKWGANIYIHNGNNIVSYGGFKNFVSIWFYNGVFLKDKYKVLVNASEGKTKSLRQWRFTSIDEIDEKKILEYVKEAVALEEKGMKLKPEKFKAIPPSEILANALAKDKKFKTAFEALTPGKQKEYILYIDEAKQEATKLKRIEKIIPMVQAGQGLNDKYKNC